MGVQVPDGSWRREGRQKVEEGGLDSPEMSKRVLYGGGGGKVAGEGRERKRKPQQLEGRRTGPQCQFQSLTLSKPRLTPICGMRDIGSLAEKSLWG